MALNLFSLINRRVTETDGPSAGFNLSGVGSLLHRRIVN